MDIVVTILLWLLGIAFTIAGAMKAFVPEDRLTAQPNMAWIEDTGIGQARIAGISEVVAGVTLVLAALDVSPFVTLAPWAAIGLVVVMVLAIVRVHRPRGEPIVPHVVLGGLALLLAILLLVG